MDEVSMSDDERFAEYGAALADAIDSALDDWLTSVIEMREAADVVDVAGVIASVRAASIPRLNELAAQDLDAQRTTPLEILRTSAAIVTAALTDAAVPEPDAIEFGQPGDPYGVGPMAFADLGADVADAGLAWGAAKAHVHLQRRS